MRTILICLIVILLPTAIRAEAIATLSEEQWIIATEIMEHLLFPLFQEVPEFLSDANEFLVEKKTEYQQVVNSKP